MFCNILLYCHLNLTTAYKFGIALIIEKCIFPDSNEQDICLVVNGKSIPRLYIHYFAQQKIVIYPGLFMQKIEDKRQK